MESERGQIKGEVVWSAEEFILLTFIKTHTVPGIIPVKKNAEVKKMLYSPMEYDF